MTARRKLGMNLVLMGALALAGCVTIEVRPETFFYVDAPDNRQTGHLPTDAQHVEIPYPCGVVELIRWPGGADETVVYFGGNDFRLRRHAERIRAAMPTDVSVVMFDYPGRGGTTGNPDPDCFVAAGSAVAEWSKAGSDKVTLHGFSFGGFMASEVGRLVPPDLIILEATAVSAQAWARARAGAAGGVMPVRVPAALSRYNNAEALSGTPARIWVVVGDDDRVAGVEQSEVLYARLRDTGRDVTFERFPGGHGGAFASATARAAYAAQLKAQ